MEQSRYLSLGEAYRTMYSQPAKKESKGYAARRDEKMAQREKSKLNVEAVDMARVINAIIEEGVLTKEQVQMIIGQNMEEFRQSLNEKEMSIDDQMRISREAAANRKPWQPGDREKQRAAQMRAGAAKTPKDTRSDAEKMADAYASVRKGPGGATRAD